jgi:hypothetical protein
MANVSIYPEHRDILDALITTGKVSSIAGATRTGPFSAQRDAYVFAAALSIARGKPHPDTEMPSARKEVTTIRDSVFLGAAGAEPLTFAVVLIDDSATDSAEAGLSKQLDLLMDDKLQERLTTLDRYAYAGFEWLRTNQGDERTIRELVLTALDEITCVETDPGSQLEVQDPLLEMLLD